MEKASTSSLGPQNPKTLQLNMVSPQVGIPLSDDKGKKSTAATNVKGESSSVSGSKVNSQKEMIGKSNDVKKDKRKWALEVLARKTATTGSSAALETQEDKTVLKGAYPLLAQLPIYMRPVLAPSRHNKIPISVRQAQLYRLIEHFLRKANLPIIRRTADTEFAVADAVNIEKEVADRSNSKLVYVNLMSQEILHQLDIIKPNRATESDPSPTSAVPTDKSEQTTNDVSDGPMVEEALKNAGLLSDSPPNSPYHQMGEANDEYDLSGKIGEDPEPGNVFEMDSHPDLDIYGDFEYDLEDEDFIGASAIKASKVEQEESKIKVVFSTLNSNISNNADGIEDHEGTNDVGVEVKDGDCINQDPLTDGGGEEPSLAECEELYGPDKEPLTKRFPESALIKKPSENVPIEKGENIKCLVTDVSPKVEAYIKEHIRPLCKSGVITVKQYRWAVEKTTEKVMKYHSKEKNAKFLIKEGNLQVENRSMTNSSARDDKLYDSAYSLVENENNSYVNRVLLEFNASITSNDSHVRDHHPSTPEHSLRGTSEWEEAVKSFLGYPVLVCGMQHQQQQKQKTLDQIGKTHSPYLNLDEFRNITRQEKGGIASNRLANITHRLEPDGTSYNYASATKGA
ncbi:hypothetical protein RHGRI_006039 [Rhododendron griersonianum]|uniref:Uncharacterized protein n=1 Tax=Rhododendron griersonianum TaxID=479676 RepID=A0AAV6LFH2_9ERIC|nr:hypothetical protein RHGRI_006039 [Rhododendron griersonianum]